MSREYDFGEGGKVSLTHRTNEHGDMFKALETLGEMGAKVAHYINELKANMRRKDVVIAAMKGLVQDDQDIQAELHRKEFPRPASRVPFNLKPRKAWVATDSHTPGPWRMSGTGMIRVGGDWICSVTARNRIYNASLIEAAPDMLAMIERMLSSTSPQEAQTIIADAKALVEKAKAPAWERAPYEGPIAS